jgi:hypothetical protein
VVLDCSDDSYRDKHFQLHTLYCNDSLDISGIIDGQSELQLLGIYTWGGDETLLEVLKSLDAANSPLKLPIVFALERESFLPSYDHLSVFPAFYPNRSAICQAFADSFEQDVNCHIGTEKASVSQVSIYLRDFSDMALFRTILEDVVQSFPRVNWLNLSIEDPKHLVSCIDFPLNRALANVEHGA